MDDERSPKAYTYFVPDYFPGFSCKIGTCRSACCSGWPVSISRENYFHLLGVDCTADLRRRLDCSMRMADYPTPECYAYFEHRYDGECALRMADGRCAVHAELGEDVLADVCRLYPRGVRRSECGEECSAANSCEATLELLWEMDSPIAFADVKLPLKPPELSPLSPDLPTREERMMLISYLQEEGVSPAAAIARIGESLGCDAVLGNTADLSIALDAVSTMLTHLGERNETIRALSARILTGADRADYTERKQAFLIRFPRWTSFVCRVLVNHLFFEQFPCSRKAVQRQAEFRALCAIYGLVSYFAVNCIGENGSESELIDAYAALFRLVEHSNFTAAVNFFFRGMGSSCASMLLL